MRCGVAIDYVHASGLPCSDRGFSEADHAAGACWSAGSGRDGGGSGISEARRERGRFARYPASVSADYGVIDWRDPGECSEGTIELDRVEHSAGRSAPAPSAPARHITSRGVGWSGRECYDKRRGAQRKRGNCPALNYRARRVYARTDGIGGRPESGDVNRERLARRAAASDGAGNGRAYGTCGSGWALRAVARNEPIAAGGGTRVQLESGCVGVLRPGLRTWVRWRAATKCSGIWHTDWIARYGRRHEGCRLPQYQEREKQ